jgi:hypothetical protein
MFVWVNVIRCALVRKKRKRNKQMKCKGTSAFILTRLSCVNTKFASLLSISALRRSRLEISHPGTTDLLKRSSTSVAISPFQEIEVQ